MKFKLISYRLVCFICIIAISFAFGSCNKKEQTSQKEVSQKTGKSDEKSQQVSQEIKNLRVAYLINGALGDQAFYDSGQMGINKIASEFGVETLTIENNFDPAKYLKSLETVVNWKADIVFATPYHFEDLLKEFAKKYPNIKFISIEPPVFGEKILSVDFKENEGAFLAGVTAALMTTDVTIPNINPQKIVGIITGDDSPIVMEFVNGYEQGVSYIDSTIEIKKVFIGDWADASKGREVANQLYLQGVDVIFQVAAQTGIGVLEAARQSNKYAIGIDTNQNGLQPGFVPTSMVKYVGDTIYLLFKQYIEKTIPVQGMISFGLKDGVIDLIIDDNSKKILPQPIIDKIETIKQRIISEQIKVR